MVKGQERMRSTSGSAIAWKMPEAPPRSTISSASSAALSTVTGMPRPRRISASVWPSSVRSKPQAATVMLPGSPPPRSLRIRSATASRIRARSALSPRRRRSAAASPSSAQAGSSAAVIEVLDAV